MMPKRNRKYLQNLMGLTNEVSSNHNVVLCDMIPSINATSSFKKIENTRVFHIAMKSDHYLSLEKGQEQTDASQPSGQEGRRKN